MFCHILPGNISPIIRAYDIPRTGVCTKKTHPVNEQIRIVLPRFMDLFLPKFCNSLSNQHFVSALRLVFSKNFFSFSTAAVPFFMTKLGIKAGPSRYFSNKSLYLGVERVPAVKAKKNTRDY